jgi:hypothetical protein
MPIDIFLLVKNRSRFERLLTLECKTEQAAFLFPCHRQILQEEFINRQEILFLGRILSLHIQWVYLIDIYPSSGMKCFSAQSYLSNTRAHSKPLIVMPAATLRTMEPGQLAQLRALWLQPAPTFAAHFFGKGLHRVSHREAIWRFQWSDPVPCSRLRNDTQSGPAID